MSVSTKHGLYGVQIGATLIGGINAQNIDTGTEIRGEASSDELYARFQSMVAQKVAPGFTTMAISTAIGACGLTGVSMASSALTLYAQKHTDGGGRASGSNHRKYVFNKGILAPNRLSCDHQGDATLSYQAVAVYDGNNDPVVVTDSVALPAGITDAERFSLGTTTIGDKSLTQIKSLEIDFGVDIVSEGADSDVWDTLASIRNINTVITLRGIDVAWLAAAKIPLAGLAATHANTSIQLRKRAAGGKFAGSGHITITAAGMIYVEEAMSASGGAAAEVNLRMPCYFDGTNAPILFS